MIEKNSGLIYQLKLEHNLGYCAMQTLNFLDTDSFSGRLIYVYDYFSSIDESEIIFQKIESLNFLMKAIRIIKFPTKKNINIKYIGKTNVLADLDIPIYKAIYSLDFYTAVNWNELNGWFYFNYNTQELVFTNYNEIRNLETSILNTIDDIAIKVTMYYILKNNLDLNLYYDLNDDNKRTIFIDLINTYFSLEESILLLNKYNLRFGLRLSKDNKKQ